MQDAEVMQREDKGIGRQEIELYLSRARATVNHQTYTFTISSTQTYAIQSMSGQDRKVAEYATSETKSSEHRLSKDLVADQTRISKDRGLASGQHKKPCTWVESSGWCGATVPDTLNR